MRKQICCWCATCAVSGRGVLRSVRWLCVAYLVSVSEKQRFARSDAGVLKSCVSELPRYDRLRCKPIETVCWRSGVVCLELRMIGVPRAVSMFIVVVQVMAASADFVRAVSPGVDVGTRSDRRPRVTVRAHAEVSGYDCARDAERAYEGLCGARLSGRSGFELGVASFCALM